MSGLRFIEWAAKHPAERFPLAWDFAAALDESEAIADAIVTVSVRNGVDATPGAMLYGALLIEAKTVFRWCTGGVSGVNYLWRCDATTTTGKILTLAAVLPVRDFA